MNISFHKFDENSHFSKIPKIKNLLKKNESEIQKKGDVMFEIYLLPLLTQKIIAFASKLRAVGSTAESMLF